MEDFENKLSQTPQLQQQDSDNQERLPLDMKPELSPAPKRTTRMGEPKETAQRGYRMKEKAYAKTPNRFKNASSFQVRLRTGIVYIVFNVAFVLAGDLSTMIILATTAGVCAGEFYYMMRADAKMPNEGLGVVGAAAYPIAAYFWSIWGIVMVTIALMLAVTVWYVYWLRARVGDMATCVFGAMYTGLQLSGLLFVRMAVGGIEGGLLVLVIFCSIWMNDSGAYLFGSKFGKHKLAPHTSPNKSWEGFIAGLVFSMGFWCLCLLIPSVDITVWECLLFGLVCGVTSVLGDLFESRVKRTVGMKDSGTVMPGHGGLFDRCDSLMPTSLVSAVLLFSFGCIHFAF